MKYVYLLATLLAVMFSAPHRAGASCAAVSPQLQFDQAEVVVQAKVTSIGFNRRVYFEALRYYKGNLGYRFSLPPYEANAVTSVDVDWENGKTYAVYLRRAPVSLKTNVCDGTVLWEQRSEVLKDAEPGVAPTNMPGSAIWPMTALILAVGVAMGLGRLLRRA